MPGLIEKIEKEWKDAERSGYTTPGWYFWDETDSQCYGPFDSETVTEQQRDLYFENLNKPKEEPEAPKNDSRSDKLLSKLNEAVSRRKKVRLIYRDRDDTETSRVVRPLATASKLRSDRFLLAWCQLRGAFRTFRVDRIVTATVLEYRFADIPGRTLQDMHMHLGPLKDYDLYVADVGEISSRSERNRVMSFRHRGNKLHRLQENPLEEAFSDAWEEENTHNSSEHRCTLAHLMSLTNQPAILDSRDVLVAANVVQWLGSPVGQAFLAKVLSRPEAENLRKRIEEEIEKRTG